MQASPLQAWLLGCMMKPYLMQRALIESRNWHKLK